ncbi:hypothetical protein QBC37DRAFT_174089, partial [Rhypophila decipiens]
MFPDVWNVDPEWEKVIEVSDPDDRHTDPEHQRDTDEREIKMANEDRSLKQRYITQRIIELEKQRAEPATDFKPDAVPRYTIIPRRIKKVQFDLTNTKDTDDVDKMMRQLDGDPPPSNPPSEPERYRKDPVTPRGQAWETDTRGRYQLRRDGLSWYKHRPLDVAFIRATWFQKFAADDDIEIGIMSLHELDRAIEE